MLSLRFSNHVTISAFTHSALQQFFRAPVAQWIEHQTTDLGVTGSTPVGRTINSVVVHIVPIPLVIGHKRFCSDMRLIHVFALTVPRSPSCQPVTRSYLAWQLRFDRIDCNIPESVSAVGILKCIHSGISSFTKATTKATTNDDNVKGRTFKTTDYLPASRFFCTHNC